MIEAANWPKDLHDWDPTKQPYYLEVFGETSPVLATEFAAMTDGTDTSKPSSTPIYEYWWTIGHPGHNPHAAEVFDTLGGEKQQGNPWDDLRTVEGAAARVYLFFPTTGNWRIKEIAASVNYLTPVREQADWWSEVAKDWQTIAPVVNDVSKLAGAVPGPGFSEASSILGAMAKVQINSAPQAKLKWSVAKVTFSTKEHGMRQGIMWELPQAVFDDLGGRITGSLAVSFISSHVQDQGADREPKPAELAAHAVVYMNEAGKEECWAPDPKQQKFIYLTIAPTLPTPKLPESAETVPEQNVTRVQAVSDR